MTWVRDIEKWIADKKFPDCFHRRTTHAVSKNRPWGWKPRDANRPIPPRLYKEAQSEAAIEGGGDMTKIGKGLESTYFAKHAYSSSGVIPCILKLQRLTCVFSILPLTNAATSSPELSVADRTRGEKQATRTSVRSTITAIVQMERNLLTKSISVAVYQGRKGDSDGVSLCVYVIWFGLWPV